MKDLDLKYIELLLKKCIWFNDSKILYIEYNSVNKEWVLRKFI